MSFRRAPPRKSNPVGAAPVQQTQPPRSPVPHSTVSPSASICSDPYQCSPPAGVRASSSGARVTSWGVAGIDSALGGGIPLGSLVLLVEDAPTTHHEALLRVLLSQGVAHGHAVALAQAHAEAGTTFAVLPRFRTPPPAVSDRAASQGGPELSIAWRYAQANSATGRVPYTGAIFNASAGNTSNGVPRSPSSTSAHRHAFDLSETCRPPTGAATSHLGLGVSVCLSQVLDEISLHIENGAKRGLVSRVVLCGLAPGLWSEAVLRMPAFLHRLRILVQRAEAAIAVVSIPALSSRRTELQSIADAVLRLDTCDGRGAGVVGLGDTWLGTMSVVKPFRLHSRLRSVRAPADIWVFKRGRRKYVFEPAAAAPDVEEHQYATRPESAPGSTVEKPAAQTSFVSSGGCGSAGSSGGKFDF